MIFVFLKESGIISLAPGSPEEKNLQRSETAPNNEASRVECSLRNQKFHQRLKSDSKTH